MYLWLCSAMLCSMSKLDELRRSARSEADMRFEKERGELGRSARRKVESQIQQAEGYVYAIIAF